MKVKQNDLPALFDPNKPGREARLLTSEKLKETGILFTTYGIQPGDVVQFDDEKILAFAQKIQRSDNDQILLACKKNDVFTYVAMGSLLRADIKNNGTCKLTQQLRDMADNNERVAFLTGKTIKAEGTVDITVRNFYKNQPVMFAGTTNDKGEELPTTLEVKAPNLILA